MRSAFVFTILLSSSLAFGHARLDFPVPRSQNAGIKTGPCGADVKGNNPLVLTVGQQLTLQWRETIEHPGRYYFALSDSGGDLNFVREEGWTEIDLQNDRGNLPHLYQKTVTVPNKPCVNCTLQMIQSMEENPNNPTFYYSCADVTIQAANNGGGGNNTGQGTGNENIAEKPGFGGCGTIGPSAGNGPPVGLLGTILLLPMLMLLLLRRRELVTVVNKRRQL